MLELKNICKTYKTGDIETKALDNINVAFREKEFVAILGTSGSGKTTCLNIIGGLDRYDSGDLIIKGKKTKNFTDKDWDAYRNNSIGFIFQSYNLITHLSIVSNVEMGMTLSGVSASEKRKRAIEVLEKVGLKDHINKKPNQLSGGQMQRVAIARALANDPEILLCDEPTGALDTETSVQIMDLIKEVAKDKLVIMVTHNPELAHKYADRIIEYKDGHIINDTHPHQERPKEDQFNLKKTAMKFRTALGLSFNNIMTKKGRTFLTSFASSIGIIGIAIILSLSTGFKTQIDAYQRDALSEFPIIISQTSSEIDTEDMMKEHERIENNMMGTGEYADTDYVSLYDSSEFIKVHTNKVTDEFVKYLEDIDPKTCSSIGYTRTVGFNALRKIGDKVVPINISNKSNSSSNSPSMSSGMNSMKLSSYPTMLDSKGKSYVEKNYELLAGKYPKEKTDVVLVIEVTNELDYNFLKNLGFETEGVDKIDFDDIVGTEFKIVTNNDYYAKTQFGGFVPNTDYNSMYDSKNNITINICGIVRVSKDAKMGLLNNGIAYSDELSQLLIESNLNSDIVKAQEQSSYNVMTMEEMDETTKNNLLQYLGGNATPFMTMVYPTDFDAKDKVTKYIDDYNKGKDIDDQIIYTDLAENLSDMTGGIMDGITYVLLAFAAVSLVVSLIMICIITYTSVLERTKEIGILKALGARKKDITRVFDAETCILGVFSGVLGVVIAWLCTFPINSIIYNLTELDNCAHLQLKHAVMLVIISTVLTVLGGHIPARMASKKDAVEALRSE